MNFSVQLNCLEIIVLSKTKLSTQLLLRGSDTHVVGRKMARNGRNTAMYLDLFFESIPNF